MKSVRTCFFYLIAICWLAAVLSGCGKNRIVELKKERLFSIPIGRGEEEIGILKESNGMFLGPEKVLFKNGFFFIVDSVNQKLLKITTPGDIILVIAKGRDESEQDENVLRTKQRKYYSFNKIGNIAVDNENNVYIEDIFLQKQKKKTLIEVFSIDEDFKDQEAEYEEIYMSNILKFDRLGNFLYKIGKNGMDSEPFYYVYKMDVDADGNLIVLTANDNRDNWNYYKFDPGGNRLAKRLVKNDDIVAEKDMEDGSYFIMDVLPSSRNNELIYWVSHYETAYDTKEIKKEEDLWGEEIEIEDLTTLKEEEEKPKITMMRDLLYYKLLYYNLESDTVDASYKWGTSIGDRVESTEEFLGIDGEANGFLWKYIDKNRAIITLFRPDGTVLAKRSFMFEDDGLWMNIQVAIDGSVSAIKVSEDSIHFYRWRSDRLINNKREKVTVREFILDKVEGFKNANR